MSVGEGEWGNGCVGGVGGRGRRGVGGVEGVGEGWVGWERGRWSGESTAPKIDLDFVIESRRRRVIAYGIDS